jgi:hypothetical protein
MHEPISWRQPQLGCDCFTPRSGRHQARRSQRQSKLLRHSILMACTSLSSIRIILVHCRFQSSRASRNCGTSTVLVHVSVSDLQRNVDRYSSQQYRQFDHFAPGWRTEIKMDMNQQSLRTAILEYWSDKVHALGLPRAKHCQLISGSRNQRLYWLILLARHDLAHDLWEKISSLARSPMLPWDED